MRKIKFHFKADLGKPQHVPFYFLPADHEQAIYEQVYDRTEDNDLAIDVMSWALLAPVGDEYENDVIAAEIIEE